MLDWIEKCEVVFLLSISLLLIIFVLGDIHDLMTRGFVQGGNPMLASATPSVSSSQTSQPGSNVQPAQVVPQQALPMHYSQPPSGPFGNYVSYQYMPASYPYLQPPYPHHVYNSSSTAYAQPPAGSTYTPPSAASSYPAGGATAVKFPMPQYKPGAAAGNAPHPAPAVGYGGYTTTPSGYASSPAVTVGNASGYEDMNTSRYKDSTLYIPSQQVWRYIFRVVRMRTEGGRDGMVLVS